MLTIDHLGPLQRDALREAIASPTRTLVRTCGGFMAPHKQLTSGAKTAPKFTKRLINMLDRDGLVHIDDPTCPTRATLNAHGVALAEQLRAAEQAKAVRS